MRLYVRLLIGVLRRSTRGRRDLLIENLLLRQQLEVYAQQQPRWAPRLTSRAHDRASQRGRALDMSAAATVRTAPRGPDARRARSTGPGHCPPGRTAGGARPA